MTDSTITHTCPICSDVHLPNGEPAHDKNVDDAWEAWNAGNPSAVPTAFHAGWNKALAHATQVQTEWTKKQIIAVIDVFENADEDALADDVMQEVFDALGIVEAFTR